MCICVNLWILFQIFGIIFTISQGKIMDRWGTLAGNVFLCIMILIGAIITGEILTLYSPFNNELQAQAGSCRKAENWILHVFLDWLCMSVNYAAILPPSVWMDEKWASINPLIYTKFSQFWSISLITWCPIKSVHCHLMKDSQKITMKAQKEGTCFEIATDPFRHHFVFGFNSTG